MKIRKMVGTLAIVIGLGVSSIGIYAKYRVGEVRKSIDSSARFLPDNPVNKHIGKALDAKISAYDMPILMAIIGGGILIVLGVGSIFYRKK